MKLQVERGLICPKCPRRIRLRQEPIVGGVIDKCVSCRGIWFDADEVNAVKDALAEELRWKDIDPWSLGDQTEFAASGVDCPSCTSPMSRIRYRSVEIDFCVNCEGIWCDGGEIVEVLRELSAETDAIPFREMGVHVRRQLLEIVTGRKGLLAETRDFLMAVRAAGIRLRIEKADFVSSAEALRRMLPF